MSVYTDQINKLYRLARKFKRTIRGISQVGEIYDKTKFNRSKVDAR